MHRRILAILVSFASLAFLVAACGDDDDGGGGGGSAQGDGDSTDIVIALEAEPRTLDPQITQDGQMRRVAENIFERLVDRDLDNPEELVPRLAASLPENVDPTTWEVKIREGVEFTNGEPFNAEVAAAAIMRESDPEYDSELLSQVETITNAEAVDDTTLRITTAAPDPILPSRLYMIQMVPMEYAQDEAFARDPVGTGPYQFVEWAAGDHITVEKNPNYWGDEPEINRATFRFMPENQTRVAALQTGEVQMATGIAPESGGDVPQQISREGLEYSYLRLKNYEGPFQDERVRKAVAYAVNVPEYIETIYGGNASQANCQTNGPAVFGFNPDLEPYDYDPDLAKQLLEESGYDGTEVRIIAPTGRWLKYEELAEAIDADLEAIGLKTNMEMIQFDPWLTEFIQHPGEGQPDGALSATSNELLDSDRISSLVGESGSVSSNKDPELEAQLAAARTELDTDAREQMYHDIASDICDKVSNIAILTFKDNYGASENLVWTPRIDGTARVEEMSLSG
jgi:peptide/nickel transport system substrate-binding protein